MKIFFICPTREWLRIKSKNDKPKGTFFLRLPSLAAATIAALTPKEFEFRVVDEQIDYLDINEPVDLIAITCNTATARRAYEIAELYKKKGVPVVLGGIHPSLNPSEACKHGTVVIGPAEPVWQSLLNDFKQNNLKKIYHSSLSNLSLVRPDRTVYNGKKYLTTDLVETSRGCIHHCNFCSTASAFNGRFIKKSVSEVIGEIKSLNSKFIFFVDDNLIGDAAHAKALFRALIPLKIKWISQVTYLFGLDDDLLHLANKSGCMGVFIGFDSISDETLRQYNKSFGKVELYKKAIRNIHKNGILIQGSFIFGSDAETGNIFENTLKFVERNKIDGVFFGVYTPLPSTPVYQAMNSNRRIINANYDYYDYRHCVFEPRNMSPQELEDGVNALICKYFMISKVITRFFRTLVTLIKNRSLLLFLGYYIAFLSRNKMLQKSYTGD